MRYRCGSRSLSIPTHHTTRQQVRENIQYGGVPPPNHHYSCGDPRRPHPTWDQSSYRFPHGCAHRPIECATPGHYRPARRLFQLGIPWLDPSPNTVACSISNPSKYKIPKENAEASQATTPYTPPTNSKVA